MKYRTQKVAKNRHLGTIAQLCRAGDGFDLQNGDRIATIDM